MKQRNRILSLMLAILLVVGMVPVSVLTVFAATSVDSYIDNQNIVYELYDDNTATVVNSDSAEGDIVIPETVTKDGMTYTVTAIGNSAFSNTALTSVIIPYSVKNIADSAFYGCAELEEVIIYYNGVQPTVGNDAFANTPALTNNNISYVNTTHSHCVCGGNTDIGDHTAHPNVEFTPWNKTDAMPTATGNYVLMNDVTLGTDDWDPADGTVLCLNGKTLTLKAVDAHYDFTLCDCTGKGKIIGSGGSVYTIAIAGSKTFTMYGGTVFGGDGQSGVYVYGHFNMYGGTISNGKNTKGGGVFLKKISYAAQMTMYGGTISGNQATDSGGGVYIGNDTTFTMNGGTVSNNTSNGFGGGVLNDGTFYMCSGKISDNYAENRGGGVYVSGNATFNMLGGTITRNTTNLNRSDTYGGGVFVFYGGTMTVSGASVITNNTTSVTNNLHLQYHETEGQTFVTVGEMKPGADVGISMYEYGVFSVGGKDNSEYFTADNPDYSVAVDGENLKLVEAEVQVGQVTLKNGEYTTDGKSVTTTAPTSGGYAYYKDGVLTLNNFTYSGGGANDAVVYTTQELTINAIGNSKIDSSEIYAIYLKGGDLTIEGDVLNLAVSDAKKAITTVYLHDSDGTYGGLNITNVTLNIDNNSDDQTYGIRCRDVLIDGSTLTVNMKKEKQHRSTGLDANGTVAIVRNSQVVIDLSEATNGAALITDGDVSVSDSYVELRGDVNGGVGLAFNTSYKKLDFNGGTLIIAGTRDPGGAMYLYSATIELPDGDYWWRTDENGSYSKGDYAYNKSQTYIELTTAQQSGSITDISEMDKVYDGFKVEAPTVNALSTGAKTFKYKVKGADDSTYTTEAPTNAGEYTCLITVAEDENYTEATATKDFVISKATPTAPTTPAGVNTTFINTADGKITGVDSEMEYRKDGDANYTAVAGTEITGLAAGTYYVRFAANVNYNASPEIRIVIALGDKRTPTVDTETTASRVIIGGKLSESNLTGGEASVPGEFAWVNPDAVMNTAGKFDMLVRFTPNDTKTYKTVDFEIEVEVVVCDTANGEHDFTEQMNDSDEHWTVCAKCGVEEPDSRTAHTYEDGKCKICGVADLNYKPTSPQTGDNSNMALWFALLFVSGAGLVGTTVYGRKRRTN